MTVSGVIYDCSFSPLSGEVVINFSSRRLKVVRKLSVGLISLGFAGIFLTIAPVVTQEVGSRISAVTSPNSVEVTRFGELAIAAQAQAAAEDAEKEYAKKFAQELGITDTRFYIYIPKIKAKAPIVANVNAGVEETFKEALKHGVAHSEGTSVPGKGSTYLFAHSTDSPFTFQRYNAIFYQLHTINPEDQDEIYVFHNDKLYKYRVSEKHIVDASDTSWLAENGENRLVLQTCWPPGTSWKRLIVVATPVEG